jgi:hypothetical protein
MNCGSSRAMTGKRSDSFRFNFQTAHHRDGNSASPPPAKRLGGAGVARHTLKPRSADRPPTPDPGSSPGQAPSPPRATGAWREGRSPCMTSRSRRRFCARFAKMSRPLQSEGAGNAGRPMRPIAACAMSGVERTRVSQVTPESPGIPRAMVYGLFRALPGDRAFLPPSPALLGANLTPASGRQDHTFLPSASAHFVKCAFASTASRLTSVTIAKRPS